MMSSPRPPRLHRVPAPRWVRTGVALLVLVPLVAPAQDEPVREIEFVPAEGVDWGIRNVGAMLTAPFLWSYWYKPGSITIQTVPRDARLELFYIRANFQKLFVRAEPPVRLKLPSRIMATERDALTVRVGSNGYKSHEYTYDVLDLPAKVVLELAPLPNSLHSVALTDLGGRTTATFRTDEEPDFRVTRGRQQPGFTLSLRETADQRESHEPLSAGHVKRLELAQVGEDILVRIETTAELEARSKQSYDPIRKEHVFTLDILEKGARMPSPGSVRRELEAIPVAPRDPCRRAFATVLREGLEGDVIARAHRPSAGIADLYRRQAMLRLGRTERGRVRTRAGETLHTGNPLELELALQSAAEVEGYLGLLGALARSQANPETALRSLIAPELGAADFAPIYARAERGRRACANRQSD